MKTGKGESSEKTGKGDLKENLKEFSFGLQALEDIQENLEAELKQSKFVSIFLLETHEKYLQSHIRK